MKIGFEKTTVLIIVAFALLTFQAISQMGFNRSQKLVQESHQEELSELRTIIERLETQIKSDNLTLDSSRIIEPNSILTNPVESNESTEVLKVTTTSFAFNPRFSTLSDKDIYEWYSEFSLAYREKATFSSNDREMIPLLNLAKENPELLLDIFLDNPTDSYVEMALYHSINNENAYLIQDYISTNPMLMQIAINAGMHKEHPAKFSSILQDQLTSNKDLISDALIDVSASSLIGTVFEEKLRDYAIKGQNRYLTFKSLENAGYKNIDRLANEVWQSTNSDPLLVGEWDEVMVAYTAARYGNKDALDRFIHFYKTSTELIEFERLLASLFLSTVTVEDYEQNKNLFSYSKSQMKWRPSES